MSRKDFRDDFRHAFAASSFDALRTGDEDGVGSEFKLCDFLGNGAGGGTWNDEEELAKTIQVQFDKWVRAYSGPRVKNAKGERMVESKLKIRSRSQEQRVFDKWRRFLR